MSRKRQESRGLKQAQGPVKPSKARKALSIALPALVLTALGAVAYLVFFSDSNPSVTTPSIAATTFTPPKVTRQAQTLDDLLAMSPEGRADVDIAEMNLLCARGLPGTEELDIDRCLARLDEWADRVRYWTDESMWDFRQNPGKFESSEAKFRVLLLISVLQKDFGLQYNPLRGLREVDFTNSKDAFIHGMIDDDNGGTCVSMPVMYVAVGRRLGYPLKLVAAKTHLFARWDDPVTGEKFNIEGTNARFDDHPDEYYMNWPYKITPEELADGWYLRSLTPSEELAVFVTTRGHCLMDNGLARPAYDAYRHGQRLAPSNPMGQACVDWAAAALAARQLTQIYRQRPTGQPSIIPSPILPGVAEPPDPYQPRPTARPAPTNLPGR